MRIYVNQEASSYSEDYFFNVSAHSVTVSPIGQTASFILMCNQAWTATSDSDWCVVNASDRSGNATATNGKTITFTVNAKTDEAGKRTAVIMVKKADTGEALLVNVTQTNEFEIPFKIVPTTLDVPPDGGYIAQSLRGGYMNFILWCDGNWTATSDSDWCLVTASDSSGGTTPAAGRKIWLDVYKLHGTEKRTATVTVKKTDTGETLKMFVTQSPVSWTCGTDKNCFVTSDKNAATHPSFNLWSNGDWTAESDSSWLIFVDGGGQSLSGKVSKFIRLIVRSGWDEGYHDARVATVTVTNKASGETAKFYVSQTASEPMEAFFKVDKNQLTVGAEGTTDEFFPEDFTLWCDGHWTVSSDSDWCVIRKKFTSGGNTYGSGTSIYFDVKGGWEEGYHPSRTATITVKNHKTGKTLNVYVTQEASKPEDFFNVSQNEFTVGAEGATLSFDLKCNKDWTAESDADWCVIGEAGKSGGDTSESGKAITFTVKVNDKASERYATITVTNKASGQTLKVYVSQEANAQVEEWDHFFSVRPKSLTVSPLGGTFSFILTCAPVWKAESDSNWCVINPADILGYDTGADGKRITFTVAPYSGASPRKAIITVRQILPDGSEDTRTVEVEQMSAE